MGVALQPFPGPRSPFDKIEVNTERSGAVLRLRFLAEGDAGGVAWPGRQGSGRADELWKHTCFEAFVLTDEGYVEFNLSPSWQWASYRFDGYREGMRDAEETATVLSVDVAEDRFTLEARIDLPPGATRLTLSAVIEDVRGEKTYWALAHPSDKPDFHHPDSFVLDIPPEPS